MMNSTTHARCISRRRHDVVRVIAAAAATAAVAAALSTLTNATAAFTYSKVSERLSTSLLLLLLINAVALSP